MKKHLSIILFSAAFLAASCANASDVPTKKSSDDSVESAQTTSAQTTSAQVTSQGGQTTSDGGVVTSAAVTTEEVISEEESTEEPPVPTGTQIVKIMFHVDSRSPEGLAYKKRIDAFNSSYASKGIRASATYKARTTGGADYEKQLIAMRMDNTLPDIITFDAPNCASYADSGLLYDVTNALTQDEKNDFLSLNTFEGHVYGLPIQESSAGFYYNKSIFRDAGIDVSGYTVENPWTFAQFKEVCQKLKNANVIPVDMRLDATKDETATYLLYPFIYAAGGDFVSEDGYTATGYFNKQESKNGFQFLKDLVTSEYSSYAIGSTDFFTGKVGMYLSSGWTIPDLDNKYPERFPNRDSWGLLPYPKDVTRASATGSWSYAITQNATKDKAASIELLKWMASAESSTTVTNATGMIPCRKSCNPQYAAGSPESILFQQLSQTGRSRPVTVGYPQFTTVFSNVIYRLRDGDVSTVVDNAARELQAELNKI